MSKKYHKNIPSQKSVLIISNLYPSKKNPYYGSFVKNFEEQLESDKRIKFIRGIYIKGLHGSFINKIFSYFFFYIKILFFTIFFRYDLVYVHLISHSTLPLRFVSYVRNLSIIFNIHGEDLLTTTPLATRLLQLSLPLVKKAKYIVVPSMYFKKITTEKIPDYPQDKIIVSASGGIKDIFFTRKKSIKESNDSRIKIGYVSRIDRGKGWDTLIKALKILDDKNLKYECSIVGAGDEVKYMQSLIVENNIKSISYHGPIAQNQLPSFYKELDIFIFPTKLHESLGLVGIEAMATGVPVIGSNIGGLTDYIHDSINGYLFDAGNENDLAEKIEQYMYLSTDRKQELSNNAIKTAENYKDQVVSKKLFDQIL